MFTHWHDLNLGIIGGLAGSVIGLAGGLVGTYCSIKSARGPREKRFVVWISAACWFYVCAFLALLFLFPQARPAIFVPYVIILVAGINYSNRRLRAIRQEEQATA